MTSERTEQPTPRRLQDARRRGQVAVSREVDSALVLLAAFAALRIAGPRTWAGFEGLLLDSFAHLEDDPVNTQITAVLGTGLIWQAVLLLLPLVLLVAAVGVIGGVAQTGGVLALQALKPQPGRMNPLKGMKRVFASKQGAMQLAKSLVKMLIVGAVAAQTLWSRSEEIASLGLTTGLERSLATLTDVGFELTMRVLVVLVLLAVADFVFQRYDHASNLRMTRQEVKDELRQSEGDPLVRGRAATLRRSFMARVMEAVPTADVVITNPTHYAVALKYDPASSSAPRVVAKGRGLIAQRMRELAREHGVPVIANPPLTRTIYRAIAVGHEITADLYEAVAEVLAFVYRLRYPQARSAA